MNDPRSPAQDPDSGSGLADWTAGAADWIARADRIAAISRPATEILLARLDPQPGQRILDVASGAGDPAFSIAERVGSAGSVLATDGVAEMVTALEGRARERGLTNVQAQVVSAESLAFTPGRFDGASCRFGAMFFDDAARTFGAMATAVRSGGRLAALVWSCDDRNPYFTVVTAALDAVGADPVEVARTVFELDDPEEVLAACRGGGWVDARVEAVGFPWRLPDTRPETLIDTQSELSRKLRKRMEGLSADQIERARGIVAERVGQLEAAIQDGDDLIMPAECLALSGRAP